MSPGRREDYSSHKQRTHKRQHDRSHEDDENARPHRSHKHRPASDGLVEQRRNAISDDSASRHRSRHDQRRQPTSDSDESDVGAGNDGRLDNESANDVDSPRRPVGKSIKQSKNGGEGEILDSSTNRPRTSRHDSCEEGRDRRTSCERVEKHSKRRMHSISDDDKDREHHYEGSKVRERSTIHKEVEHEQSDCSSEAEERLVDHRRHRVEHSRKHNSRPEPSNSPELSRKHKRTKDGDGRARRADGQPRAMSRDRGDVRSSPNRGDTRQRHRVKRERRTRSRSRSPPNRRSRVRVKQEPESPEAPDFPRDDAGPPKSEPDFKLSGKLAADTNTYKGVVIKYNQPPEARKSREKWRLYPFKGDTNLPVVPLHRSSGYLIGRDRIVADIPIDHPSCSKQHAVLQFRLVDVTRADGSMGRKVKPYTIDLGSTNGTFLNGKRIEAERYHELREKDVLKFGFSSREYVLLHEKSQTEEIDEGFE